MHTTIETPAQRDDRLDREASLNFRARRFSRYANHLENFKDNEVPLGKPAAPPGSVAAPAPSTGDAAGCAAQVAAV
ncbi:hypothetical protein [Duganella vulcania]|uniref:Uncharacterized protein n=1 Tax=Duganella vulcania TaxID=2692166 RepID=A0A845GGK1_9BURK|nr:hypothetical protein [Duganella vulcania]MYM92376.1 hypothetical protein [Duganella vulcania]